MWQFAHVISTPQIARSGRTVPLAVHLSVCLTVCLSMFALRILEHVNLVLDFSDIQCVRSILNLISYVGL
jgi:hypothetical protein